MKKSINNLTEKMNRKLAKKIKLQTVRTNKGKKMSGELFHIIHSLKSDLYDPIRNTFSN
jgi:hypothetical protein